MYVRLAMAADSDRGGLTYLIVLSESIRERAYALKEKQEDEDMESVSASGKYISLHKILLSLF